MSDNDKNLSPYSDEQFEEEKLIKRIKNSDKHFVFFIVLAAAALFTPYKWLVFVVLAAFWIFNKLYFYRLNRDTQKYFDSVDENEK